MGMKERSTLDHNMISRKTKRRHQDKYIRKLAREFGKDERVVKEIVYSPLKFATRVISDPLDSRPVRVRYFGVFALKHVLAKDNLFRDRVKRLKAKIGKTLLIMANMGYLIKDESSVVRILDDALADRDHEKIQAIWEEYQRTGNKV